MYTCAGSACLVKITTDVDATGKSYYGESKLVYVRLSHIHFKIHSSRIKSSDILIAPGSSKQQVQTRFFDFG
jgi:hypothetical protein